MANTLPVLVSAAFACGGAWQIGAELLRVYHVRTWSPVTGQVLNSHWRAGAGDDDLGPGNYGVQIEYQYSVSGSQYRASKHIMGLDWSLEEAEGRGGNLCQEYPIGRELPIAYNPKRPEQSEIADNAQQRTNYGLILGGLGLIGVSFLTYREIAGW